VGHSPEVVKSYGFHFLPDLTRGRKEAKRLTGESYVPVLVIDDGQVIGGPRPLNDVLGICRSMRRLCVIASGERFLTDVD
jgi:hypothetical protein